MRSGLMFIAVAAVLHAGAVDMQDAIDMEGIEITISGLDGSEVGYEDKDLKIGVLNYTEGPVTITAEPGFVFSPEAGDVQDMILTEPIHMVASNEYYNETGVHAMCIESSDKSPRSSDVFNPSKYADGNLKTLAQYIHDHHYQNHIGQDAMWVLSNGHSVYDITGAPVLADPIREFVAGLTGVTIDTSKLRDDYVFVDRRIKEYGLYLRFYLQERDDIQLQLFNQKGEFERNLLERYDAARGEYNMKYRVSLFGVVGEKFYVRLFVGDEMRKEFTLVVKET